MSIDPLEEETFQPYSYGDDNPVNRSDPSGQSAVACGAGHEAFAYSWDGMGHYTSTIKAQACIYWQNARELAQFNIVDQGNIATNGSDAIDDWNGGKFHVELKYAASLNTSQSFVIHNTRHLCDTGSIYPWSTATKSCSVAYWVHGYYYTLFWAYSAHMNWFHQTNWGLDMFGVVWARL